MSDYMFMLESHLTGEQYRLVGQMQAAATATGLSLYLTGGAMRDVLGGFPVRDLDFTVEGNPAKLVKLMTTKHGGIVVSTDEPKKSTQLRFEGGVSVEIAMARSERFPKSGAKPVIEPATIHEDLRCRDFTVNAVALSLNKASLGLLVDPTNGVGDIERKELRAVHNYSFYDDPSRMLRLIRFKVRLGYAIDERTRLQYENAREAEMLTRISPEALGRELRNVAAEPDAHDLLVALEQEKLIELYSPVLTGLRLNLPVFSKLQKARHMVPFGLDFRINTMPLFLYVLFEKLNPKERERPDCRRGADESGNGRSRKTCHRREEAGARSQESQAAKGVAALCASVQDARGTGAVPGGVFDPADRARPHSQLLPEVFAGGAGGHQRSGGGHRRGARHAQVPAH